MVSLNKKSRIFSARTLLLYAMTYWPAYIIIMLWLFAAKYAEERMNNLHVNFDNINSRHAILLYVNAVNVGLMTSIKSKRCTQKMGTSFTAWNLRWSFSCSCWQRWSCSQSKDWPCIATIPCGLWWSICHSPIYASCHRASKLDSTSQELWKVSYYRAIWLVEGMVWRSKWSVRRYNPGNTYILRSCLQSAGQYKSIPSCHCFKQGRLERVYQQCRTRGR